MQNFAGLTKHPPGSVRELAKITASLTLVLISASVMGFIDRIILARYSLHSLEACASAVSLSSIFQMFCVRIAYTTQIFIGQHHGAGKPELMGSSIWQAIWFSLLSIGVTMPLGWIIGPRFFAGTSVAETGLAYFQVVMAANFLFPLAAALSSFYLGRGRMRFVLIATFASQALNILLDLVLVFGIEGIVPPLGALGAALATATAQLALCAFLFADFFQSQNRQIFGTGQWRLSWDVFGKFLKVGIPRSVSAIILLTAWAASTHIMMRKGGDYMAVMAFGSSVLLLTMSLLNGLTQGVMTAAAYAIGAKFWPLLWKIYKSGCLLGIIEALVLAIPCIFFPGIVIGAFFKQEITPSLMELLKSACVCLWIMFLPQIGAATGNGMLMAYGDTMFHMLFHLVIGWIISYGPVYVGIGLWGWPANTFFLCTAFFGLVCAAAYFYRLRQQRWMATELA